MQAIAKWCESHTRACNRRWICVNTKELTARRTRRQYSVCVPPATEIRINVATTSTDCEALERFVQQDWLVERWLMRSTARLRH
jgi:hypothetical protein